MNIGRMRQRVTFIKCIEKEDELGQSMQKEQEYCTVWATLVPVKDGEYYETDKIKEELTWKLYVRYITGVTADMLIKYKEHAFKIVSVIDRDFKQRILEIMCVENIQGGIKDGRSDSNNGD